MSGSVLLEARLRAGLSRAEAARRSGTSRSALLSYETGAVSPTLATATRILAAYGFRLVLANLTR
jgi:transcriptional regulator with XRE-family HTH domain